MAVSEGNHIGKYRLVKEIGRGGMGVVYLAVDTLLEREVALKVLWSGRPSDRRGLEAFKREARAVARLTHPNIVHINSFDFLPDHGLFIDMPFMGGGSMRDLIHSGLSYTRTAAIGRDILQALTCCHREGIIHCDVKPSNLLFDAEGTVKLSDFGIARISEAQWRDAVDTRDTTVVIAGTPQYMCPESFEGADPAPAFDLYSLGVVLRESVTGEPIFHGKTPYEFLKVVHEGPQVSLETAAPDLSPEFRGVIDGLMAPNPENRYTTAAEALMDLQSVPETQSALDASSSTRTITLKGARGKKRRFGLPSVTRRGSYLAGALLIVTALVFGTISFLLSNYEPAPAQRPQPASSVRPQSELFATGLSDVQTLLDASKDPAGQYGVYDLHPADIRSERIRLLVRDHSESNSAYALGYDDTFLYELAFTPNEENAWDVAGAWGGYVNGGMGAFQWGEATGTARWNGEPQGPLTLRLSFQSHNMPNEWEQSFVAASSQQSVISDTRFLHDFERQPGVIPAIANEFMPRLRGDFFDEHLLPAVYDGVVDCRPLDQESFSALEEMPLLPPGTGRVRGRPYDRGGMLFVDADVQALYLTVRYPKSLAPSWRLSVAALGDIRVPYLESPVWFATITEEDAVAESVQDGVRVTHAFEGDYLARTEQDFRVINVRVPHRSLIGPGVGHPSVLRLNVRLTNTGGGEASPLLEWGWPEFEAAHFGIAVILGPSEQRTIP